MIKFIIAWALDLFKQPEVKVVVPPKEDKDFFGLDRPVKKPVAKKKPAVKKPAAKKVVAKKATKVVKKAK